MPVHLSKILVTEKTKEWVLQQPDRASAANYFIKIVQDYIDAIEIELRLNPTKALQEILQKFDLIESEWKNQISCRKGCSFCCHIRVEVSQVEADLIAIFCKKHKIPINKKYLKAQLRIPEDEYHLSQKSACVFLKNKECSIYPVRPLRCRSYAVVSDPHFCKEDTPKKVISVINVNQEAMIGAILSITQSNILLQKALLPYSK